MTVRTLPGHGTYSRAFLHKCDCRPCRGYRLRAKYDRSNGVRRRTGSTQVRAHTERLIARGWTQAQIAAASNLHQSTVSIILSARFDGCSRTTAAAILGIRLDQAPPIPRGLVDATGTRRRLQALAVLGYSLPAISRQSGVTDCALRAAIEGLRPHTRITTATRVARLYRQLATRPAPPSRHSEKARNRAMARGWHGPMAWADIDDPACLPDPDEPPAPGHLHPDDVTELAARGLNDAEIAGRLKVSPRTVLRARLAHNIPTGVAA